ncbi:MAG: methyltransferase domain-containing protein [Puniceicoccales bacterium]|jgi:SAM-dependent methyltransferase|nr:methyltransferase domain-containing protein [Puniceicoccales bacterium]
MIINKCRENAHTLGLLDSLKLLSLLPNDLFIIKVPGLYPENQNEVVKNFHSGVDVIICYSVLHHIYEDTNIYKFLDSCLKILKPEGEMLIGDIPNVSKRKRFFASDTGKAFHRKFTGSDGDPEVQFNVLEKDKIDDSVLHSIILRAQYAGF